MRSLVIVRPEPGATATATAARTMGLQPIVIPLFEVQPVEWDAPDPTGFDALLLTSANAVRMGGAGLDRLRSVPAHCVGEATAAAARNAGFEIATTGKDGVDSLLDSLPQDLRLLHLCGLDRREPKRANQAITPVAVYRAEAIGAPDSLAAIHDSVVAIHSPRAARRLGELVDSLGLERRRIAIAALSREAAAAAGSGWQEALSADRPNEAALLAIAAELCKKPR
ncbi:MAG: uroporphyrinogen-III synthase [Sphingomicrobium sp.]